MYRRFASILIILPLLGVASGFALNWHLDSEPTNEALCSVCPDHHHHNDPHHSDPAHHGGDCGVCHLLLTAQGGFVLDASVVIAIIDPPTPCAPVDVTLPNTQLPRLPANPRAPPIC